MLSLNPIFDALRGRDSYELRDRVIYRMRYF